MNKLAFFLILLLIPCLSFGQLFPKVPDFNGKVKKVIEKRYGKELAIMRKDSGVFKPGTYSGWKYIYLFNSQSELRKRSSLFHGKVKSETIFQTKKSNGIIVKREITRDFQGSRKVSTIEYENFTDKQGRITRTNVRNQSAADQPKELVLIETAAEYNQNKLISFMRHSITFEGDSSSGEKCTLIYSPKGQLEQILRKDISSGFSTSIRYFYNTKGWIDHYSIDLMAEIQEYGREQIQEIYFKCDRHGNWTRMYWKSGKTKQLEAKRTIRYY